MWSMDRSTRRLHTTPERWKSRAHAMLVFSPRRLAMRISFLLASTLFLSCTAVAQTVASGAPAQSNTIYSGADGKFEASPDTAVLRLDISAQQDTPKAAFDHAAATADRVRQALKDN